MGKLEFLNYVNRSPHKEALASLALEEGMNSHQVLERLVGRRVGTDFAELRVALFELECNGLLASVNDCYHFQETWFKELVRFLDEFEESKKEMDLCEVMLGKARAGALSHEKERP